MTARRALLVLACLAVAALIVVGLTRLPPASSGGAAEQSLGAARTAALLAGSPRPLAALHTQGGALLEGGDTALQARLAKLKGYPVVINKWASWCGPCKEEFPAFQRVSAEFGARVAFLGIDSEDHERAKSLAFLKSLPVSYPSYYDPSGSLGLALTDSTATPTTVFMPVHGRDFIREGEYPSAAKLRHDVERYALEARR